MHGPLNVKNQFIYIVVMS